MTNKDKYRSFCGTEKSIPIFSRDWWLDTACGEAKWDVLLIEQKGRVLAALPLYIPCKGIVSMPPFTQTLGPWFAPDSQDTKYTTTLGKRQELCATFIDQLRAYSSFSQNFHYGITDWLPFYWEGYQQTTRYTYLFDHPDDLSQIWAGMSRSMRRNIRKAKESNHITIKRGIPVEDFLRAYEGTFRRQRISAPQDTEVLKRLIKVARERSQGDLWGGYDEQGNIHAAVFVIWQESSAYYLAGGGDPALRDSGAHSLVLWECVCSLSGRCERFDFEGSMIPGVERFFREFGAVQTPYFTITKGKLSLLDKARIKWSKWI